MARSSLITGVSGQDGWYLSHLLRDRGRAVFGLVRPGDDAPVPDFVTIIGGDVADSADIRHALEVSDPDEIFNLAAVSSVAESWRDPVLVAEINALAVARLLTEVEARARSSGTVRIVHASSAEIFGASAVPHNEQSLINPLNPYGASKAYAHGLVGAFRAAGMHVSNAVLYNHESVRRPAHFVTRKITRGAAQIAAGVLDHLELGDLTIVRDWGHAPEYMDALLAMAHRDEPADFVIATGVGHTIEDFVRTAFSRVGIADWSSYVTSSGHVSRPTDVRVQFGDPGKAASALGWTATTTFEQLVDLMVDADVERIARGEGDQ